MTLPIKPYVRRFWPLEFFTQRIGPVYSDSGSENLLPRNLHDHVFDEMRRHGPGRTPADATAAKSPRQPVAEEAMNVRKFLYSIFRRVHSE